jgi:hypothetical protein
MEFVASGKGTADDEVFTRGSRVDLRANRVAAVAGAGDFSVFVFVIVFFMS